MTQVNLISFPGAVNALRRTKRFFLNPVSPEFSEAIASVGPVDLAYHATIPQQTTDPQDMISLAREHLHLQRDIHLDFVTAARHLSSRKLRVLAGELDSPSRVKAEGMHDLSLVHRAEPDWFAPTPRQLAMLTPQLRHAVAVLHEADTSLARMSVQEELRTAALEICRQDMRITLAARQLFSVESKKDRLLDAIDMVYTEVGRSGRSLNMADQRQLVRLRQELGGLHADNGLTQFNPSQLAKLTDELNRLARRHNRRELRTGLLKTPQMSKVIAKALPPLIQGRPVLLVGETGGAKTALAVALAQLVTATEPELVSFHGEINTYQLIGRDRIEADGGMSFRQGPVLRAMVKGVPLILDELNAAPAEFLKRLNVIMQLRPGDAFLVQEDTDSRITVRPGFCIITTANEKSARYKGVEVLSAELKNRFGTNVYRIGYPDSDVVLGELPSEGLALAEAALADELGNLSVSLPDGQLTALVKAAHATQKLFIGDYGDKSNDELVRRFVPIERISDGAQTPALVDSVLSPRMVVAILEQVRDGLGRVQLTELLHDWITGVERLSDREVLRHLLNSFVTDSGVTLLGNPAWSIEPAVI